MAGGLKRQQEELESPLGTVPLVALLLEAAWVGSAAHKGVDCLVQFLGERGAAEVEQMTSIRDNLQITGDVGSGPIDRLAAQTAIQIALTKVDDADARQRISTVLNDDKLTTKEKSQRVLRIQSDVAKANQVKVSRLTGVQSLGGSLTAQTKNAQTIQSSGIAGMFLNMDEPKKKGIADQLRKVAEMRNQKLFGRTGAVGATGRDLVTDEVIGQFQSEGFTPEVKSQIRKTGSISGEEDVFNDYVEAVEVLASNFTDNKDLQHQIFQSMLFDKNIFADGAVDMAKVNAIIEQALSKATSAQVSMGPSTTEINNFQKQLNERRCYEAD